VEDDVFNLVAAFVNAAVEGIIGEDVGCDELCRCVVGSHAAGKSVSQAVGGLSGGELGFSYGNLPQKCFTGTAVRLRVGVPSCMIVRCRFLAVMSEVCQGVQEVFMVMVCGGCV
jgi:hypothetical protein